MKISSYVYFGGHGQLNEKIGWLKSNVNAKILASDSCCFVSETKEKKTNELEKDKSLNMSSSRPWPLYQSHKRRVAIFPLLSS